MPEANGEVTINRPIEEVFAYIADGKNNGSWRPSVISISQETDGEPRVGTTFRQKMQGPGGRPVTGDYEIVALDPNKRLQFKVIVGPVRPEGRYDFEKAADGTKFAFTYPASRLGSPCFLRPWSRSSFLSRLPASQI